MTKSKNSSMKRILSRLCVNNTHTKFLTFAIKIRNSETITSNVCAVGLEKLDHGRAQKVHAQEDAYNE